MTIMKMKNKKIRNEKNLHDDLVRMKTREKKKLNYVSRCDALTKSR